MIGPFLLWMWTIGMTAPPGSDGLLLLERIRVSELVVASNSFPKVSLASLLVWGTSRSPGPTAASRSRSESEREQPCPSVRGDLSLRLPQADWTGQLQIASCRTWTGQRELLPGFYFTQATYGLTLQVKRETERAPQVRLSPKLHLSFLFRMGEGKRED